jgi:hypothetical protein
VATAELKLGQAPEAIKEAKRALELGQQQAAIVQRLLAVEPGAACVLSDVLQGAEKRIQEFVSNVDRYAATESLTHQSVNKWEPASELEARRFGYLAAISEGKPGYFNVEEYRTVAGFPGQFPGGVETRGLPALALIFHPDNVGNFDV